MWVWDDVAGRGVVGRVSRRCVRSRLIHTPLTGRTRPVCGGTPVGLPTDGSTRGRTGCRVNSGGRLILPETTPCEGAVTKVPLLS